MPASIYQGIETSIDSRTKPDFKSLHLHTFQPNKRKRSLEISLSRDSIENDPEYQEVPKELFFNLPSTRLLHIFCFRNSTAVPTHQEEGSPIPLNVDPTAYNLITLEVENILHSPLTPLVLPPPVPEPVCEMHTPALFTIAQSSPQPQSVTPRTMQG